MPTTIGNCLEAVGASDPSLLSALPTIDDEFRAVKRCYFRRILAVHPDKRRRGGSDDDVAAHADGAADADADANDEFRLVQESFEILRSIYERRDVATFASSEVRDRTVPDGVGGSSGDGSAADGGGRRPPPWEYYAEAAGEDVPTYRVELARSGRSKCKQKGKAARKCEEGAFIAEGEVRVGWIDEQSGSYGNWVHLECWRVPSKVWLGLPDPDECDDASAFEAVLAGMNEVLLCGVRDLPEEARDEFVRHVMDRTNWAKLVKKRKEKIVEREEEQQEEEEGEERSSSSSALAAADASLSSSSSSTAASAAVVSSSSSSSSSASSSGAIVSAPRQQEKFVIPVPGVGNAKENALLGKKVVLTGTFPEVGGGTGISLGKKRMTALVESFGGKVTGSVSGRTDFVVVGKAPGARKVSDARARPDTCKLLNLKDLKGILEGGTVEDVPELTVSGGFSKGYGGNSVALKMSAEELAIAAGTAAPRIANEAAAPAETAPSPAGTKSGKKNAKTKTKKKKGTGKKRSADGDGDDEDEKKPAAKKTKKARAAGGTAAKKAKAASDKAARKAKAAADRAAAEEVIRKRDERRSGPVDEYDWRSDLEAGKLDGETVPFLKDILRHLGLALKGKKSDLVNRLRTYAANYPAGPSGSKDSDSEEEETEEEEEGVVKGENDMDVANTPGEVRMG